MKLKNKKTGEMGIVSHFDNQSIVIYPVDENWNAKGDKKYIFRSLAELNEEWEDMPEEPKGYWYIDSEGTIIGEPVDEASYDDYRKEIGNYFEAREEAEKVVERLRARKRLKDKGFRVNGWMIPEEPKTPHIKLIIEAEMDVPDSPYDLDLLFGGEE